MDAGKAVGLTRDHPVHERIHFADTPMWMNDFMVARPGAPLLDEALRQLAGMVTRGFEFNSRNAVMETGPGLLNRAIRGLGGLEAASVQYLPWEQIHPLPDMTNEFPERDAAHQSITSRNWRDKHAPWVAHYWYHTWCSTRNMVVAYQNCLFADRGEAAMERLAKYADLLGPREKSVRMAMERVAMIPGPVTVIELGVTRSYISSPPPGVDGTNITHWRAENPEVWDWGAGCFTRVAAEALGGYDFQLHGVDPSPVALGVAAEIVAPLMNDETGEELRTEIGKILDPAVMAWSGTAEYRSRIHFHQMTAEQFLTGFEGQAELIYMDHGECNEATAQIHCRDAGIIVERGLVKEGGLVLIDDHGHETRKNLVPKSKYSLAVFLEHGWEVIHDGLQILLQRPYEVPEYIPRTLHVFCDNRRLAAYGSNIPAEWRRLHPDWTFLNWGEENIRDFIMTDCPDFLETFVAYPSDASRLAAGKFLILKKMGGVAIGPDILPTRNLEDLLTGQHMLLVANCPTDSDAFQGGEFVHSDFLAGSADNPFWNGIEHDLRSSQHRPFSHAAGSGFLSRRLRDSLRFLSPNGEWPELLDESVLTVDQAMAKRQTPDEAWMRKIPFLSAPATIGCRARVSPAEISVAIMTVERPQGYLHATLESLRLEWRENTLLLFPGSPASGFLNRYRSGGYLIIETTDTDWDAIWLWSTHRKAMWNYWRCLQQPVTQPVSGDWGRLIIEDDVRFAQGWSDRFLLSVSELYEAYGDRFILSLYSPHESVKQASEESEDVTIPYPAADFYGTQAVFFPEAVRRDFADYLKIYGLQDNLMTYDCLLGRYCAEHSIPLFTTVPSLVQHTGIETTGQSEYGSPVHQSPSFLESLSRPGRSELISSKIVDVPTLSKVDNLDL